jgi:tyrosinase
VGIRKNQSSLSAAERKAFVDALLALKKNGTYDTFVQIHVDYMVKDPGGERASAHRVPSFLPWHRQMLIEFEWALQAVNPTVTIPYWDWTVDNKTTSSIWADDFLGGDGRLSDDEVTTGPFAGNGGAWKIVVSPDDGTALRRRLGRVANVILPTKESTANVMRKTPFYDIAPYTGSPVSFRYMIEQFQHGPPHAWIGGHMLGSASPNDPAFWLHHCFIDKLWADWQRSNPAEGYVPIEPTPGLVHRDSRMGPWNTKTPGDVLDVSAIYTYA